MASPDHFRVAIVGGGLCGLALAIALKERSVPFTVYESRASFMELGAGINLGPNTLQAFRLIDPSLVDAVTHLFTKHLDVHKPKANKDLWMTVRLAAPTDRFEDGHKIMEISAPPTGNATVRRNDLLQLLADKVGAENARFGKKVIDIVQDNRCATLKFSDDTEATADVVIACDGIHSAVRRWMVGEDSPAARSQYSQAGVYRAVLPVETMTEALGKEIANASTLWVGPNAYFIQYPVDFGRNVNIGLWPRKPGTWDEREWVLPSQKKAMEADFATAGDLVHKIMALMPDPPFFAAFHHAVQPPSPVQGRVCLIGDAAHSMGPHLGSGAGQAIEDAYVIANAVAAIASDHADGRHVALALKAYDTVRTPHSQRVLDTSMEAFDFWTGFHRKDLSADDVTKFAEVAKAKFPWIWYNDLEGQAQRAKALVKEYLGKIAE